MVPVTPHKPLHSVKPVNYVCGEKSEGEITLSDTLLLLPPMPNCHATYNYLTKLTLPMLRLLLSKDF